MHAIDARARWLATNVLPARAGVARLVARRPVTGLDVDDIVQETYAKLSALETVDDIQNARSCVFGAAYSVIVSHVRHARVVPMHSFAQFESGEFVCDEPDPERVAIARGELTQLAGRRASRDDRDLNRVARRGRSHGVV